MAKQLSPIGLSQAMTAIILKATRELETAQKAEQFRVWKLVQDHLRHGRGQLSFKVMPDGSRPLDTSGANIKAAQDLIVQLGKWASPGQIMSAIKKYNEAATQISKMNQQWARQEFPNYAHSPAFNLPLEDLLERTRASATAGQYTDAFRNPIRTTLYQYIQQGKDYNELVDHLQQQITGINPNSQKTWAIRKGLLENYHQLKRVTRDLMFQTLGQETEAMAEKLGPKTVWYQYIGGTVEDSRDECIRRVGLRYFSHAEVNSWNKLTRKQWPEKIPGVPVLVQRGGYNCLHDIRIISASRVPQHRLVESVQQGYITQDEYDRIEKVRAKAAGREPKPAPDPPVQKKKKPGRPPAPDVDTRPEPPPPAPTGNQIAQTIDLRSELGVKGRTKNIPKGSSDVIEGLMKRHGIGTGLGQYQKDRRNTPKSSYDGLPIDAIERMLNTAVHVQQKYGYVVKMNIDDIRQVARAGNGVGQLYDFDGSAAYKQFTFGLPGYRSKGANMSANGARVNIAKKYASGSYLEQIETNKFADQKKFQAREAKKSLAQWEAIQEELNAKKARGERLMPHERSNLFRANGAVRQLKQTIERAELPLQEGDWQQWSLSRDRLLLDDDPVNSVRNTTLHEFGHVLHYQIFGMGGRTSNDQPFRATAAVLGDDQAYKLRRKWTDLYSKYADSEWTRTYSKYASTKEVELFAESFLMYDRRPDLLPEDMKDFMDQLMDIQRKNIQYFKDNDIQYN